MYSVLKYVEKHGSKLHKLERCDDVISLLHIILLIHYINNCHFQLNLKDLLEAR